MCPGWGQALRIQGWGCIPTEMIPGQVGERQAQFSRSFSWSYEVSRAGVMIIINIQRMPNPLQSNITSQHILEAYSAPCLSMVQRINYVMSTITCEVGAINLPISKKRKQAWRHLVTWPGPGFYPWVPRDSMVGSLGPAAEQQRDLLSDDPGFLKAWEFLARNGAEKYLRPGTQVPHQGIRCSAGALSSGESCQKPSVLIPKGRLPDPLRNKWQEFIKCPWERDVVNMCFKPKLVPNENNC